jgi:hypothetical protein
MASRLAAGCGLAGLLAACVETAPPRLPGIPYSGDIDPTLGRPSFARAPAGEAADGAAPARREPGAARETAAAAAPATAAPADGDGGGEEDEEDEEGGVPVSPSSARQGSGGDPSGAGGVRPGTPAGFALDRGAGILTAADWAELAELARRQRSSGGTVRLVVYRADSPGGAPDAGDRSLERANAMAAALVRLGVEADRIAVATVDRPPGGDPGGEGGGRGPRVFLDSEGAPG